MGDARTSRHELNLARRRFARVSKTVLVADAALKDEGQDVHVGAALPEEPGAWNDPILVDHAERAKPMCTGPRNLRQEQV